MGDNIFQSGTIVSGCNFTFDPLYAYCKLGDVDLSSLGVVPSNYVGLFATNQNQVKAYIKNYASGFISSNPNLNTIYIDYITSGTNLQTTFVAGDTLTISDANNQIWAVGINSGGSTYSNNDTLVIVSQIAVNVSSGTFQVGETVTQSASNTRAVILSINTTMYTDRVVIALQPYSIDLANTNLITYQPWNMANNVSILGSTSAAAGNVIDIFGRYAGGLILTDGSGRVNQCVVSNPGTDYRLVPYATVKPRTNAGALSTGLSLTAKNYYDKLQVPSVANVTGFGYAMSISKGIVYQKGFFIDVDPQTVIVDAYSNQPNNVSVVFQTSESIITSDIDATLLDNALGYPNDTAPGADRLQLIANLVVVNTSLVETSSDYLVLASFSEGLAYKQNQTTQYAVIESEMATRTYDAAGNFVTDPFYDTTRSPANTTFEANTVTIVVDPGVAYVDGYRVQTITNDTFDIHKGTDLGVQNNVVISMNYDNYIQITEVGGLFQFEVGAQVTLYDTAKTYLTNTAACLIANTSPAGNVIGTARMRSMVWAGGTPGTNSGIYNLYLFDVVCNTGAQFSKARAVSYSNSSGYYSGIGDIILVTSPTTQTAIAQITGNNDALLFPTGFQSLQQIANTTYTYRSINNSIVFSNTGIGSISLVANPNETFPYTGNLSATQMLDLYVVPLANNLIAYANLDGNVSVTTTSPNVTGSSTLFSTELFPGDYIQIVGNTSQNTTARVSYVVNSTLLVLTANVGFINTGALVYRYFPPDIPVPFGLRSGLTANVSANQAIMTLNFGQTFNTSLTSNVAIGFNATRSNVNPGTKAAVRNLYVGINLSNNAGGTSGPWCLGIPDIIRLDNVFYANSSYGITPGSIVDSFYIDHGQTADYLGTGWLYLDPSSAITLSNTQFLVVQFDIETTTTAGFMATQSYVGSNVQVVQSTDSLAVTALGNSISTWEVPELYDNKDGYYDLLSYLDFRPVVNAVANLCPNTSALTVNPNTSLIFNTTTDYKFPLPGSSLIANLTFYEGRYDLVVMDTRGFITAVDGVAAITPKVPPVPGVSMLIDTLYIPPYPGCPANPSSLLLSQIGTRMASEKRTQARIISRIIRSVQSTAPSQSNQAQGYTMAHIGELERRIQALEYYVSLNQLETLVTNQTIPSSISNSVSRFKYGFFVDDYSTPNFSDLLNPEYAATLYTYRDRLYPLSDTINLVHGYAPVAPVYTQSIVCSQNNASYSLTPLPPPPGIPPLPPGPPAPCVLPTSGLTWQENIAAMFNGLGAQVNLFLEVADNPGTIDLWYFGVYAGTSGYTAGGWYEYLPNPSAADFTVGVYQSPNAAANSWTLVANSSSASYVAYPGIANSSQLSVLGNATTVLGYKPWDGYWWQLSTPSNPNKGVFYYISITAQTVDCHRLLISFPINSNVVANCINSNVGTPIPTPKQISPLANASGSANVLLAFYPNTYWTLAGGVNYTPNLANVGPLFSWSVPLGPPNALGFTSPITNTMPTIWANTTLLTGFVNQYLMDVGINGQVTSDDMYFLSQTYLSFYDRPPYFTEILEWSTTIVSGSGLTYISNTIPNTTEAAYVAGASHSIFSNVTPYNTAPTVFLTSSASSLAFQNVYPTINTTITINAVSRGTTTTTNTSVGIQSSGLEPNNGILAASFITGTIVAYGYNTTDYQTGPAQLIAVGTTH